jgi:hypothetical protein
MEREIRLPDGLASDVNAFAAETDVSVDRAHEVLLSVGLDVLESVEVEIYEENGSLVLECPNCASVFDSPGPAIAHECEN